MKLSEALRILLDGEPFTAEHDEAEKMIRDAIPSIEEDERCSPDDYYAPEGSPSPPLGTVEPASVEEVIRVCSDLPPAEKAIVLAELKKIAEKK